VNTARSTREPGSATAAAGIPSPTTSGRPTGLRSVRRAVSARTSGETPRRPRAIRGSGSTRMVARGARRVGPSGAGDARPFPGVSLPRLLGTAQRRLSRSRRDRVGPVACDWGCLGRGVSGLGARGLGVGAPEHERRPPAVAAAQSSECHSHSAAGRTAPAGRSRRLRPWTTGAGSGEPGFGRTGWRSGR
jgi:hypothetical protein